MAVEPLTIRLPGFLKRALSGGHPWVYRDHVPRGFSAPSGSWVRIQAGNFIGYALWDEHSPIALRVFSAQRPPDAGWTLERVRQAWELRELVRSPDTSAFRWLNGEGDGLPGITVDLYGGFAVLVSYADAVEPLVPWVVDALEATTKLAGVLRRRKGSGLELLSGRKPPRELVVSEHGLRFAVDLYSGQKTGLFLDHRDNRRTVGQLCAGRRVLNLFSYSGGFSVYAAAAGAAAVTSVDSAPAAMADAARNFELNGLDPGVHEPVVADAFEFLERAVSQARRFDVVVCDPPSFARDKGQLEPALKAYARLNTLGLRVTELGGIYAAASCTAQVSPQAFRETLADSARRAKRRLQILHDAGQAPDHPVMAGHLEGRYLKFVVGRALAPG